MKVIRILAADEYDLHPEVHRSGKVYRIQERSGDSLPPLEEDSGLLDKVIEWCVLNGEHESRLLCPDPDFKVSVAGLFDFLSEVAGVPKEELGAAVDRVQAERAAKNVGPE